MSQRERIIEQTTAMLAEQGIKSIRMDDVAKTLGVSKRTLYEMFADKEELLYLCISRLRRQLVERSEQAMAQYEGNVAAVFEGLRVTMEEQHVLHRIMGNMRKFYPELFERIKRESEQEQGERLYSIIKRYIDEGLIMPQIDLRLSITLLYHTTTTVFSLAAGGMLPDGVGERDVLMYALVNFFRGISTVKGVMQIDDYFAGRKGVEDSNKN